MSESTINEEIVAVISAAIAAFGMRSGKKLVVREIKRLDQTAPIWNTAGKLERISRKLNSI